PTAAPTTAPAPTEAPPASAGADPATAATAAAQAAAALGGSGLVVTQETLSAIFADLAGRVAAAPGSFSVVTAEAVSWPDGSLGCPQPGLMYPQVITEGFRVVVEADGAEYAYHGDDRGQFVYCENPAR
ncbi:MAG TPA: hypothetical protein PKD53_32820, partial [Chloroflexaceae bacterium]|nr:hypothetical protein [Chloroflexaceae bacterium]